MKIISCKACGVVLDAGVLSFPNEDNTYDENGVIRLDKARWDGEGYIPVVPCPSCRVTINEQGEEML